jgi:hypothetical protein
MGSTAQYSPANMGHRILEESFTSGPSAGVLPFRMVAFDTASGDWTSSNVGTSVYAPVLNIPAASFTNGQDVLGVTTGPVVVATTGSDGNPPASPYANFTATVQGKPVNVRTQGVVPVLCDDTTNGTNINPGDYVAASASTTTTVTSQTVNMNGTGTKAARTNNTFSANQHIIGMCYMKIAPATQDGRYAMVNIHRVEV